MREALCRFSEVSYMKREVETADVTYYYGVRVRSRDGALCFAMSGELR
jgi:hypothetical protein